MLITIVGSMGSGKTLFLVYLAKQSKREIYSNFRIETPLYKPLEVIDLLNLPDNINVYIDEGYTWLESRTSGSTLNRYLSYIVLQSRKRTIDIYVTAQMFSSLDVRFREQSDVIIKCQRLGDNGFRYDLLKVETGRITKFILPYQNAIKYFDRYDTYEIVEPHTKEMLEFKLLENNPKKLYAKIKEIGDKIKKGMSEITHDRVKASLMKHGFNVGYESLVYVYLKDKQR